MTTTTARQAEISRRIIENIAKGMTLEAAMDAVCGKGAYNYLLTTTYNELRK